jgi:redox-sensitive bicupin YhaK (pirin superfamily)
MTTAIKKKVTITSEGFRADIGPYKIMRILPNRYVDAVGPFVFLDHALPMQHAVNEPRRKANGEGAHPHRGIATLTYMLNGEAVHLDSKGHYAIVKTGGVQWMKAGNGIIHDEVINVDERANNLLTHGLQFWVNLPAVNKAEPADYVPVQSEEVPVKLLDGNAGWIKVIAGSYENLVSEIPAYSKQFIYHVHLEKGQQFSLNTLKEFEYAAFLPLSGVTINDSAHSQGEFIRFSHDDGVIELKNDSQQPSDIILFGGEPYTEAIVAQGPFVMNTHSEIADAWRDYYAGKYGEVDYSLVK